MSSASEIINAGSYNVHIGNEVFHELKKLLDLPEFKGSKLFILVDERSLQHCLPVTVKNISALAEAEIIEIESGEQSKNIEVCTQIWLTLGEYGADRKAVLVNLGGGVISDLGGFVASTYKRGIRYINIPTTLLAQVDASIGGKTGIDLNHLKNEVGVFSNPEAVFIYPPFLETLDKRQLLSGFAEVIKHALIADANYWSVVRRSEISNQADFCELVHRSVDIKNKIVAADPKEMNVRKVLNFGHTVGHALETYALENDEITLLHGEAIAIGMICEAWLSVKRSSLDKTELESITTYILSKFRPVRLDKFDDHRLVELMKHDKKNEKGTINFTLLESIGKAVINKTCTVEQIRQSLAYYREQAKLAL